MPEQPIDRLDRIRRLDFSLPPFQRVSWVSDAARAVWRPRLQAIVKARPRIFAQMVLVQAYPCARLRLTESEASELQSWIKDQRNGLLARPVGAESGTDRGHPRYVIGKPESVEAFASAWDKDQRDALDGLRGLPDCCRAFRGRVRDEGKWVDPLLAQALNTADATIANHSVQLASPGLLNMLPASLGVLPLAHTPCSMRCEATRRMAEAWVETARVNGFAEEMDHLKALLAWPMEWSALHGVAELKMPVLKMAFDTDATAETYRVRLLSDEYPVEGVYGLTFPFQQPTSAKISGSIRFKAGLANPIRELTVWPPEAPPAFAVEGADRAGRQDAAGLRPRPRRSRILDQTLDRLRQRLALHALKIDAIYLSNYFNVVRLNDGSTGACMNYFRFKSPAAAEQTEVKLLAQAERDPLLFEYLNDGGELHLLQLSLKTCVASALSQNLLAREDLFRVTRRFEPRIFPPAESAVVIGFGGYMEYLIHMTDIRRVHVSDLYMQRRRKTIQNRLKYYGEKFPDKVITFSDGSDNRERLAAAELVSITGSAFCSGTMDELLEDARDCKTVIIQGQSAAVSPEVLFEAGATLVSTSIKPANLVELGRNNPPQFRALLEGGLPVIYIEPLT
jgi:hypothetical protein